MSEIDRHEHRAQFATASATSRKCGLLNASSATRSPGAHRRARAGQRWSAALLQFAKTELAAGVGVDSAPPARGCAGRNGTPVANALIHGGFGVGRWRLGQRSRRITRAPLLAPPALHDFLGCRRRCMGDDLPLAAEARSHTVPRKSLCHPESARRRRRTAWSAWPGS